MHRLTLFLVAASAIADVTATPSSVSKSMRKGFGTGTASGTVMPARVHIALDTTPSEAWTVAKAGTLTTACNFGASCFRIENTSGTEISNGSGDSTIVVRFTFSGEENLAAGEYTGTITVDPATGSNVVIDVTLTVVANEPYLSYIYSPGYPLAGCSDPVSAFFGYLAQCPVADEYPPNTGFSVPAKGASYVDARFGGTVTRITDAADGCNHRYSTASPFSINNTYIMCAGSAGQVDVWNVATQTKTYASVPVTNLSASYWSPLAGEDEVIYFLDGGTVKKRVLDTSTTSTVKDMTGAPWNFTGIADGGSSKPSRNGYLAFWNDPQVCALNLATADLYCADYSGIATFTHIDFVEVEYDSVAAKTYVKFIAAPKSPQWEVNTGTGVLDLLGSFDELPQSTSAALDGDGICETNEACLGEPHSTLFADAQGRVNMLWGFGDIAYDDYYLTTAQLSSGAAMLRPVEEGGGMRFLLPQSVTSGLFDNHFGCSFNGACVASMYGESGGITAKAISGATAADPAVITVTSHGYSNGNVKVIGGAAGNTCINGVWTLANVTTHTFELSGSTCSGAGAYDADSGLVAAGTAPADSPNRQVVWLVVPGTNGYVKPLVQHRTKTFHSAGAGDFPLDFCCNTNPRAAISMDGSRILFLSNMGVPERGSLYMVETGYTPITRIISGGTTISGGVTR